MSGADRVPMNRVCGKESGWGRGEGGISGTQVEQQMDASKGGGGCSLIMPSTNNSVLHLTVNCQLVFQKFTDQDKVIYLFHEPIVYVHPPVDGKLLPLQ